MTNEDNKRHDSHNPRAVQGCFLLYQLFFYVCSTFPSPNAILYSQAARSGFWPAKFQKRIFFYEENYYLYDLNRGVRGKCSWISSEKGFFQTYIDNYEAGRACDPAERGAGFWQDSSKRGGCSPDPCSGGGRGGIGAFHYSGAAASGYPV